MRTKMSPAKLEKEVLSAVDAWEKVSHLNGGVLTLGWVDGYFRADSFSLTLCQRVFTMMQKEIVFREWLSLNSTRGVK